MSNMHGPRIFLTIAVGTLTVAATTGRADWPNFRGPRYDGISRETGLKTDWNHPIPLVWERTIGAAFSSFAAVGDKVYTCGTANGKQVLYCLEADTGAIVWQHPIEKEYRQEHGDGTRATPTVDDGRVYILGALGTLLCLDADSGKEIWRRQFTHPPTWAYSGSVLIEGDLAIASGGESDGALVAFDKATGELRWKCGDQPVGYATPYPFTFESKRYVAGFMGKSLIIAEASTGRRVFNKEWRTSWDVNAASPLFHDGYLWIGSGYRTGCELLKLRADGDSLAADSVWKSKVLMNKFQSCILHEGHLYVSDQKALVCADFLTGQERWRKRRSKHGTLVLADNHLFLLTQAGQLQIADVSPKGFEPTATADILSGRCWSLPVLHRGLMYARNLERVVCLDLRSKVTQRTTGKEKEVQ